MTEPIVTLEAVDDRTMEYAEQLLSAAGLPTVDLEAERTQLYSASVQGERAGVGGLECYGTEGLLRSVAVEPEKRGEGIGAALCRGLEAMARQQGIETLYLLTTAATAFFETQGYVRIDRNEPPESIQQTTEFDELCPSSAVCMQKSLVQ